MVDKTISETLLDRFIRYTAFGTQSNMAYADQGVFPSTESQKQFMNLLEKELHEITGNNTGLTQIQLDTNWYLYAQIPASPGYEKKDSFGLCAHIDTASDAPGDNVHPQIHHVYTGKPILLKGGFCIDPASDSDLAGCIGDTIITSDGTSLLGADDKAGVAGIITLAEYLLQHPEIPHGPIEILFSPDEETGHGMDHVPLNLLQSKAFYTVDGGQEGEIESECFNAWKAEITCTGVAAHLGSARGKLVNAVSMAAAFISDLPAQESPEATDEYFGYFCPLEVHGSAEQANVTIFLRDFDEENMKDRLNRLDSIARGIEARYPGGTVLVTRTCQYLNMKQKLDAVPYVMERLEKAAQRAGISTIQKPIRGGTDGSRLTEMGIPTPNIFTGGHNYHSRTEWASLSQMSRMVQTLIELAQVWGEES